MRWSECVERIRQIIDEHADDLGLDPLNRAALIKGAASDIVAFIGSSFDGLEDDNPVDPTDRMVDTILQVAERLPVRQRRSDSIDVRVMVGNGCPGSILMRVSDWDTVEFQDKNGPKIRLYFEALRDAWLVRMSVWLTDRADGKPDGWVDSFEFVQPGDEIHLSSSGSGHAASIQLLPPTDVPSILRGRDEERQKGWTGRWGKLTVSTPS